MKFGFGILAVLLLQALPASAAGERARPDEKPMVLCMLGTETLSHFLPATPWSTFTEMDEPHPAPPPSRIRLETSDTLAALNFSGEGIFSPYIGAGIGHDDLPIRDPAQPQPIELRLGAGFGCALDSLTRLVFRYRFHFSPDSPPRTAVGFEDDEIHHLSLGLQVTF